MWDFGSLIMRVLNLVCDVVQVIVDGGIDRGAV